MIDHFRFLDLPFEIRELVYHELLCTWEMQHEKERARLVTRHDNPTSILRTSKQLYNESYDYLVRHNQFIHLNCTNVSIRLHPLGRHILPITEDPRKIKAFKGYVARVTWSISNTPANPQSQKHYMLLSRHWPSVLKCTDYHGMLGWPTLTMDISLDPISTSFPPPNLKPTPLRPFQLALLPPIPSLLHSFPHLSLTGPIPAPLSTPILTAVALPRWSNPPSALNDLKWCIENIHLSPPSTVHPSTTAILECGIQTIESMRSSPSWPDLAREGGTAFLDAVAEMEFGFYLRRAECALGAMERSEGEGGRERVVEFGGQAEGDLKECGKGRGSGWGPSGEQRAVVRCLVARRWRLLHGVGRRDGTVEVVGRAAEMFPGNGVIRGEGGG